MAKGSGVTIGNRQLEPLAHVHGSNALGDIALPPAPRATLDPRRGHRMMIDLVRAHPHEVTIIAVGPLTKARFWEITAIPDIRVQCASLAETVAARVAAGSSTREVAAVV